MRKRRTATVRHQMADEWVPVVKRGHRNSCCFCAAEHVYYYRVDRSGGIEFKAKLIKPGQRR